MSIFFKQAQWVEYRNDSVVEWAAITTQDLSFKPVGKDDEIFEEGIWNGTINLEFTYDYEISNCTVRFSDLHITDNDECLAKSGEFAIECTCPQGIDTANILIGWSNCNHIRLNIRSCQ